MSSSPDAAYGALLGAAVGDAAGAVLEFIYRMPSADEVDAALRMPGGGVWEVGPGQITDDTELALCLAHGLVDYPASAQTAPLDSIASWYGKWLHSPPFDIGTTTRSALIATRGAMQVEGLGAKVQQAAAKHNQTSLSNGCLMRITPMAVWSCKQPVHVVAANAAADTSLTHPQQTAQVAVGAYCIAIAHLINHNKDAAGAIGVVQDWLQQGLTAAQQVNSNQGCADIQGAGTIPWQSVLDWLGEALQAGLGPEVHQAAGWMKWGFVHAFRALVLKLPYDEAIRQVLLLGGDTDTNAAIVGGMSGAYWGAESIPDYMKDPVLTRTVSSPGIKRPEYLQTAQLPHLFEQLWDAAQR